MPNRKSTEEMEGPARMEPLHLDTSVRVDAGVLNKLVSLAGELLVARDQFRALCEGRSAPVPVATRTAAAADVRMTLVLFETPDAGQMAIPLSDVDRIEEFPESAIFRDGHQLVARHHGGLLPLVQVSTVLTERRTTPRHFDVAAAGYRVQVLVHTAQGRSIGLVVDRLIDVLDEPLVQPQPGSRTGAAASVLIGSRVTELVDLAAMLRSVDPAFLARQAASRAVPGDA